MDKQQLVDMYLMSNAKNFPIMSLEIVRQKLMTLNESQLSNINAVDLKDPTMVLIVSVVAGGLGIDRFLIGDVGMGLLKLFTGGLCGILVIYDWFVIQEKTRDANLQRLMSIY